MLKVSCPACRTLQGEKKKNQTLFLSFSLDPLDPHLQLREGDWEEEAHLRMLGMVS